MQTISWISFERKVLVVDELDITGGVLKIASIDYHLIGDRGVDPFRQFNNAGGGKPRGRARQTHGR